MTLERVRFLREWMTWIFLFLLPWQTRWIISRATLAGVPWEQGTISIYATEIIFWIILVLSIVAKGPFVRSTRKFYLLFVLVVLVRSVFSRDLPTAAVATIHLAEGLALFLLIGRIDWARASAAFILGMIPAAGLGIWQFVAQTSPASTMLGLAEHLPSVAGTSVVEIASGRYLRAYGPFPHPNIFGGYLTVALLLSSRLVSSQEKILRRLALWSSPLLATALFLTFSRGAWLAFLIGAGLILIQVIRKPDNRRRGSLWFAVSILPFLILGSLLFSLVIARTTSAGRLEARSISERAQGYRDAMELIRRHPVFGVGPGHASLAAYRDLDPARGPFTYESAHNIFLLIWVEIGLVGLLSFIILLFFIIQTSSLALIIPLLIIGLFDHYLWTLLPGIWLLWLGFGLSRKPSS